MRTIKFRAWNLVRKEMWTDFFVDTDGNICYEVLHDEGDFKTMFWPPKDKNILMQSTGLHDKNGKEIWEGDVVLSCSNPFLVKWEEGSFWIGNSYIKIWNEHCEVLGNLWENPELIK